MRNRINSPVLAIRTVEILTQLSHSIVYMHTYNNSFITLIPSVIKYTLINYFSYLIDTGSGTNNAPFLLQALSLQNHKHVIL